MLTGVFQKYELVYETERKKGEDCKTFACDERDRVIICQFFRDLHLNLVFCKKIYLKEGEV